MRVKLYITINNPIGDKMLPNESNIFASNRCSSEQTPLQRTDSGYGTLTSAIFRVNPASQEQDIRADRHRRLDIIIGIVSTLAAIGMLCYANHLNKSEPEQATYISVTAIILIPLGWLLGSMIQCFTEDCQQMEETDSFRLA